MRRAWGAGGSARKYSCNIPTNLPFPTNRKAQTVCVLRVAGVAGLGSGLAPGMLNVATAERGSRSSNLCPSDVSGQVASRVSASRARCWLLAVLASRLSVAMSSDCADAYLVQCALSTLDYAVLPARLLGAYSVLLAPLSAGALRLGSSHVIHTSRQSLPLGIP